MKSNLKLNLIWNFDFSIIFGIRILRNQIGNFNSKKYQRNSKRFSCKKCWANNQRNDKQKNNQNEASGLNRTNDEFCPSAIEQCQRSTTCIGSCVIGNSCRTQGTSSDWHIFINWWHDGRHYSVSCLSQSIFGKSKFETWNFRWIFIFSFYRQTNLLYYPTRMRTGLVLINAVFRE